MIKVIVFDFSGVVFTNGLPIAIKRFQSKSDLDEGKLQEALNGKMALAYRTGKQSFDEYLQTMNAFLQTAFTRNDIEKLFFDAYEVLPETITIIKTLRSRGFTIAYLSDNPKERAEFLEEKYHIFQYFDYGLFSWQVGIRKPNRLLYERFITLADVIPNEILYIEDKVDNIKAATELGIQTYLFTTPEKFSRDVSTMLPL